MSTFNQSPQPATSVSLTVVLPAYREAKVIADTLAMLRSGLSAVAAGDALEIIVVDDGSDDATVERARTGGADRVIAFGQNQGKGAAVRAGVLAASGEVVVFTDADLQYPPDRILAVLAQLQGNVRAVLARRRRSGDSLLRRLGTHAVPFLARTLVLNKSAAARDMGLDPQCGLKAFRLDVAREVFGRCRVDRFGFDVEVLLLLGLLGVPTAYEEVETTAARRGSSVRVFRDGAAILRDLLRIRSWLRQGVYETVGGANG